MVKRILGREEALIDEMCEKEVTSFRLCRLSACPGHRPSLPLPPDALAFLSGFCTSFSSRPPPPLTCTRKRICLRLSLLQPLSLANPHAHERWMSRPRRRSESCRWQGRLWAVAR